MGKKVKNERIKEDYPSSEELMAASERTLPQSMELARAVMDRFKRVGVTKRTSEKVLGQLSRSKFKIPEALRKR